MRKSFVHSIFSSATKIVLLVLTVALCVFTYFGIVGPDVFTTLIGGVYGFYFNNKGSNAGTDLSIKDITGKNQKEIQI